MPPKKDKCARCGKPLAYFREVLASLGNGYRRYKLCQPCADLVEKAEQARKLEKTTCQSL